MNSILLGAPVPVAPVFRMLVIFPKLAEGFGLLPVKAPKPLEGFLYCGWFSRLKAAARKFKRKRSDNWNDLVSEPSISKFEGPRAMKRPAFPQVPFAGSANAAVLSQFVIV